MRCLAVLLGTWVFIAGLGSSAEVVSDSSCNCFLTNGTEPNYFAHHVFFDFRNLAGHASVPKVITDANDTPNAPPTSDYFKSEDWTKAWQLQTWNNTKGRGNFAGDATVYMVHSPNNIYIEKNEDSASSKAATHLSLRTSRLSGFQSAAQMQTQASDYHYVSLRLLARTVGSPGGVSAFFTYRDAKRLSEIQEADLEIVTGGPQDKLHCVNQPGYTANGEAYVNKTAAERNPTLPHGLKWTDWLVYRLDWTPKTSIWYINGEEVANISFQVPRDPASVNFNSWGDGGSWSGNMSVGAESAFQIQWIDMVYNKTENNKGDANAKDNLCGAVCSIDEGSTETGAVAKLWGEKKNFASPRMAVSLSSVMGMVWICMAVGALS